MKFSEQWLREWVNPSITTDELESLLSLSGLEVDGVEKAADDFSGVVIGEILAAEQHPNADKLQVCSVSDGTEKCPCRFENWFCKSGRGFTGRL